MTAPVIGITTYGRNREGQFALPAVYVDAVRRAGGIGLLLPPGEPQFTALLERLDGVILAGGGDLEPALYGGVAHATIYGVDPERDASEIALVRQLAGRRLPTLGICRGAQVINVALGGTLIEHLPDVVGESIVHRLPPRQPTRHSIRVAPQSRLATIFPEGWLEAASWHHQAIRQPAPSLQAVAWAADGTIEAVELPAHPWFLAVQWHPELTAATDLVQQRLFDCFVSAVVSRES